MLIFQYMRIHCKYITPEVLDKYGLTQQHFDSKDYCYVEIRKGIYGLKEAAILGYDQLHPHLAPYGYFPVQHTPGLWHHSTRCTTFTLAVNNFGIKFFSKEDADHLFAAFATTLTKDWSGSNYLGFTLDWNYDAGQVDIFMPSYVPKALLTLRHPKPARLQHAPHLWTAPAYGTKVQLASTDLSPLLNKSGIQRGVQQISGLFLYYSCGCDPTIITALNKISNHQAAPTEKTKAACDMLQNYLATHPEAAIRYQMGSPWQH
jgi:hypothetical protein